MRFKLDLADIAPAHGLPPIVSSLCLEVQAGDRVAILGPSGSGKTTVLRAVMGSAVAKRLSGSTSVEKMRARGLIGYVPQNSLVFPWLSVIDNIRMPFFVHGRPLDESRVAKLVEAFEVKKFLSTPVTMLSGGMAVRVSTARALVLTPKLLLIDEAFSALDEFLRYEVWHNVIREMHDGVTLFVTHSVSDAASFGSHAIVLNGNAPCHSVFVSLSPVVPSYPQAPSNAIIENINVIRRALFP